MIQPFLVSPGTAVNLADYDPGHTGDYTSKKQADKDFDKVRDRLRDLQDVLWAEDKHALLVVFQAMDAGGKDGVIKKVFRGVNPQGCRVTSFKVPTEEELDHDFLWRVHRAVPGRGEIGVFNRSHYEDVLVVRVDKLVGEDVWRLRYDQINQFEKLLADTGTTILKFYLHISKDEQKERFQARLDDPAKNWKFSKGDVDKRAQWGDYMAAFEEAISRCSTPWAPWYIIPANHKWYRDLVVAQIVVETLEKLDMSYPLPSEDLASIVIP